MNENIFKMQKSEIVSILKLEEFGQRLYIVIFSLLFPR